MNNGLKYQIERFDIEHFGDRFGGGKTKDKGEEIQYMLCPFCKGGRSHDRWTFSVNTSNGAYNCKRSSCDKRGNFVEMCRDFGYTLEFDDGKKEYITPKQPTERFKPQEGVLAYLESRGISKETAERYQITVRKDRPNIMVFPFFDEFGKLITIKYRNMAYQKGMSGGKEWFESGLKPILFGMQEATDYEKPLIITEGQIDALTVAECGIPNATSVPGGQSNFNWLPYCADFLSKFKTIIAFGDNEHGKITLVSELRQKLPNKDIRCVRKQDYLGCKDANEIYMTYEKSAANIITAIENAGYGYIPHVKPLADIRKFDFENAERVKTGIDELDDILGGGFMEGQLILLTGKRGEGKSTLMSEFIRSAQHEGINTLIYSGEMTPEAVKNWFQLQTAGSVGEVAPPTEDPTTGITVYNFKYLKHINSGKIGIDYYKLEDMVADAIDEWTRESLYIYDISDEENEIAEKPEKDENGKEKKQTLLDVLELAIKQYQIKFLCIDNLMTAMDGLTNDLFQQQSNFVGRLKKMALKYKITVLLLAHHRKSKEMFTNDDVSGSADITNKADVVLSYAKADGKDYSGLLKITKNRMMGRTRPTDETALKLKYNRYTKHITGMTVSELSRNITDYGWIDILNEMQEEEKLRQIDGNPDDYSKMGFKEISDDGKVDLDLPF